MPGQNVKDLFLNLSDYWSPKIIGSVNDQYVKIAKVKGEFVWHDHHDEDEMFFIVKGSLTIEMKNESVYLSEGDFYIVSKSVQHKPIAREECWILLIEKKSTKHTGDVITEQTKSIEEQF